MSEGLDVVILRLFCYNCHGTLEEARLGWMYILLKTANVLVV
jgi:hypothetical protein